MNLEEQVLAIMRDVFETEDVSALSSQKNCGRWDSLHHLTLASELEEAFARGGSGAVDAACGEVEPFSAEEWKAKTLKERRDKSVSIIMNDQGDVLVDTEYSKDAGFDTRDIMGGCFCTNFDKFVSSARTLVSQENRMSS